MKKLVTGQERFPILGKFFFFFTGYHAGSHKVITKTLFVSVFRSWLARIGVYNPSRFRRHSFCRGEATWAFHTVSQVNLFKFMAIGRQLHINVILTFRISHSTL